MAYCLFVDVNGDLFMRRTFDLSLKNFVPFINLCKTSFSYDVLYYSKQFNCLLALFVVNYDEKRLSGYPVCDLFEDQPIYLSNVSYMLHDNYRHIDTFNSFWCQHSLFMYESHLDYTADYFLYEHVSVLDVWEQQALFNSYVLCEMKRRLTLLYEKYFVCDRIVLFD